MPSANIFSSQQADFLAVELGLTAASRLLLHPAASAAQRLQIEPAAALVGATVQSWNEESGGDIWRKFFDEQQFTHILLPAEALADLVDNAPAGLPALEALLCCNATAGQLNPEAWEALLVSAPALRGGLLLLTQPEQPTGLLYQWCRPGAPLGGGSWLPLPGYKTLVLNKSQKLVPAGVAGELYLGHAAAAELGNWAVANPFQPGQALLRTGHSARRLPDGQVLLLAVSTDYLTIGGDWLPVREAEAALALAVDECRILSISGQQATQVLVFVGSEEDWTEEQLRALLPAHWPATWRNIFNFWILPALPRAATGEVDDKALRSLTTADPAVASATDGLYAPLHLPSLFPELGPGAQISFIKAADNQTEDSISMVLPSPKNPGFLVPERLALSDGGVLWFEEDETFELGAALARAAARHPTHGIHFVGSTDGSSYLSYSDLHNQAQLLLAGLQAAGVAPGAALLLQLADNRQTIISLWACLLGGFVAVPLARPASYSDDSDAASKLRNVHKLLDGPLILTNTATLPALVELATELPVNCLAIEALPATAPTPPAPVSPDAVALLLFTSGSTGLPKGIQLTHRAIVSRSRGSALLNNFTTNDVSLNWMPLDHVGGIVMFHLHDVCLGCRQVQGEMSAVLTNPLCWLDWLHKFEVSVTWAPNFAFALLAGEAEQLSQAADQQWDLRRVRHILNGGEAVSAEVAGRFLRLLAPFRLPATAIFPAYGMSETCSGITHSARFDPARGLGLHHFAKDSLKQALRPAPAGEPGTVSFVEVGPPMPGVKIRIVTADNQLLTEGHIGRVQVHGATLTLGYFRNDEANRAFVGEGWFNTGDLGFLAEGRLSITGREKDVVILNGLNYYNYEIETVAEAVAGVEANGAAAFGWPNPRTGREELVLLYVPATQAPPDLPARLRTELSRRLGLSASYLLPISSEAFARTASGKKQRNVLLERFEQGEWTALSRQVDVQEQNQRTLPAWFFAREWRPQARPAAAAWQPAPTETTLLVRHDDDLGRALATVLRTRGGRVAELVLGTSYAALSPDSYQIVAHSPADFGQALAALRERHPHMGTLVHAPLLRDHLRSVALTPADLDAAQEQGVLALLHLMQAWPVPVEGELKLLVLTSQAQAVLAAELLAYEHGTLPGFLKSAALELPWLRCRHADLPASAEALALLPTVLDELAAPRGAAEVAWRGGRRYAAGLAPVRPDFAPGTLAPALSNKGFHLVSGGLGGVGTLLVQHLLEAYGLRLLLIGRSDTGADDSPVIDLIPNDNRQDERRAALRQLRSCRGTWAYEVADVTDAARLAAVVTQYEQQWARPLAGVLHLAGTGSLAYHWQHHDEHQIRQERLTTFDWMFGAKVRGALALHELLKTRPEASFVAFSSVNSYFGGGGFSAYSAANSFLEGFCQHLRQAESRPAYCLSWSAWHELGMNSGNTLSRLAEAKGFRTLSAAQGLHSFDVALRLPPASLYIGLDAARPAVARHLTGALSPGRPWLPAPVTPAAAAAETAGVQPENPLEAKLLMIWAEVLKRTSVGRHDNFFDLGGQSISAVRIVGRMRAGLALDVQLQDLFAQPTVAGLAARLAAADARAAALPVHIPALPAQPHYPASPAQQRMWLACLRHPANALAYHVPSALEFRGPFRPEIFGAVLLRLLNRHETLRTGFEEVDGELRQIIGPPLAEFAVPCTDLRAAPDPAHACRLALAEANAQPFDLHAAPLLRAHLWQLADERFVVFLTLHHLVADGSSATILLREIMALYEGLSAGATVDLPALEIQYKDYAAWYLGRLQAGDYASARAYWQQQLAGAPPAVTLPRTGVVPHPAPAASLRLALPAPLAAQLAEFGKAHGFSLFVLMRAALLLLLHRRTGARDLTIGTSADSRSHPALESQVGPFLHLLALRNQLDPQATPLEFLNQIKASTLLGLSHADYPYEQVLDDLSHPGPLFDVLLVMQNFERVEFQLAGLKISDFGLENLGSKYGLALLVADVPGTAPRLLLHYDTGTYSPATIADTAERLLVVLAALSDPAAQTRSLARLDLATPAEMAARAAFCQPPPPKRPADVLTLFDQQVASRPTAPALVDGAGNVLDYSFLSRQANQLAHALLACGAGPGQVLATDFGRDPRQVVALLAALRTGAIYLPLAASLPAPRWAAALHETTPCVFLTTPQALPALQQRLNGEHRPAFLCALDADWQIIIYELSTEGDYQMQPATVWPAPPPPAAPTGDLGSYLFYTSGSTGTPKAVLGSRYSLAQFIAWELAEFDLGHSLQSSWLIQPGFDASLRDVLLPLCAGGTLHLPAAKVEANPALLPGWLAERRINLIHSVPSVLRTVLAEATAGAALPDLRFVLLAGEKIYRPDLITIQAVFGAHVEVVNLYGASETTMVKTFARLAGPPAPAAVLPAGRAMADAAVAVVNGQQLALPGEEGEVYLKSAYLTLGYWQGTAAPLPLTVQNPLHQDFDDPVYRTGDRGHLRPDGQLEIRGRTDRQVKRHGIRFDLAEVENALLNIEGIAQQVVVAHTDPAGELWIGAFFVRRAGALLPLVPAALAAALPPAQRPDLCLELETLPLTSTGKTDAQQLLSYRPNQLKPEINNQSASFLSPEESRVAQLFCEVLHRASVPPETSFFDLGGNSLRAMTVVGRLYKVTGAKLGMDDFFRYPSVRALAGLLVERQNFESANADTGPIPGPLPQNAFPAIPALPLAADYAVSPAQRRLWVLHHLEGGAAAYNIKRAYRLRGALDVPALAHALRALVLRHESLRTTFALVYGALRQQINLAEASGIRLRETDLRTDPDALDTARQLAAADALAPFDLARGPLLRLHLLRLAEADYLLLFATHHIVGDGWSLGVMMREVGQHYEAYQRGASAALPALAIHYKDFAAWQLAQLAQPAAPDRAYWLARFREPLMPLALETDFPRPPQKTNAGHTVHCSLSAAATATLRHLARAHEATLFMALLSVVSGLLHRLTGQGDIVVGTPVAGRVHPDLEGQLGMYVNTLALRQTVDGGQPFAALLAAVRADTLQAFDHQQYPFDQLVDELDLPRDLSRSPLFDVFLALQNHDPLTQGLSGIEISPEPAPVPFSRFDLFFNFYEDAAGLHAFVEYSTDLFTEARIQLIWSSLEALALAAAQPATPLSALNILPAAELTRLASFEQGPSVPVPADWLTQAWAAALARHPAQPALIDTDGKCVSYAELDAMATRLAASLQGLGVAPGAVVAVALPRSAQLAAALLACWKTGATYLPLDVALPAGRLGFMLTDSTPQLLLTNATTATFFADAEVAQLLVDEPTTWPTPATDWAPVPLRPEAGAYIIYTSGSTGQPKGVLQSYACLSNLICWQLSDTGPAPRMAQFAAVGFDVSVQEMAYALCTGGTLYPVPEELRRDPRALARFVQKHDIELLDLPFSALNLLFQETTDLQQLAGLRHLITAGEALRLTPVLRRFLLANPGCRLHNQYGPTETHVVTRHTLPAGSADALPPIGNVLPNTEILVLDAAMQRVPPGVRGQLYLGGAGLALGYLGRPELTAEKFIPHPFRPGQRLYASGDVGYWTLDGEIRYCGRADDQLKIRGYRVEPGEIERTLLNISGLREALVTARLDADGQKYLAAYLVWEPGQELPLPEVLARLRQQLPEYMIPSAFVPLAALPHFANGKLDRQQLPDPAALAPTEAAAPAQLPNSSLEASLLSIWQQVLGRPGLGTTDHFFEAGGSSLKALTMVSQVQQQLGRELPLLLVYRSPTVKALAEYLHNAQALNLMTREQPYLLVNPAAAERPALFIFPPAMGYALSYQLLSQHLPDYALYSFNFLEDADTLAFYVTTVQRLQPSGPLVLLGHSAGGFMAFHLAKALEEAGRTVGAVILLDAYRGGKAGAAHSDDDVRHGVDEYVRHKHPDFQQYFFEHDYLRDQTYHQVISYFRFLHEAEDGQPTRAPLHLLKAEGNHDRPATWAESTLGPLVEHLAHGNHSQMTFEPWVAANAQLVKTIANQVFAAFSSAAEAVESQAIDAVQPG